jgi:hypothetical protein
MSTEMVDGLLDFACGAAGWVTLHGLMKEMPWDWNEQLRRFRLAAGQNDRSRRPRLSRLNSLVAAQRSSWLAMVGGNVASNRTEVRIQLAPPSRRVRTIAIY